MVREMSETKRIEEKSSRRPCFAKRRAKLMKKAEQLSVLCDAQIGGVIFSRSGKHYQFSAGSSLDEILQQYHDISDADDTEGARVYEPKNSKCAVTHRSGDQVQSIQRYLSEINLDQHSVADLKQLEEELEDALLQTRTAKIVVNTRMTLEPIITLRNKEKLLREENEFLVKRLAELSNIAAAESGNNSTNMGRGTKDVEADM